MTEQTMKNNGIELLEIDEVFTKVKGYKDYFISVYDNIKLKIWKK